MGLPVWRREGSLLGGSGTCLKDEEKEHPSCRSQASLSSEELFRAWDESDEGGEDALHSSLQALSLELAVATLALRANTHSSGQTQVLSAPTSVSLLI